jgi:predicted ATPase
VLTRIEIDGFKTFREFALDLPPFLVLLGPNGAGKSNLFDALRFLSRLAGEPVLEAAQGARGDLLELFHRNAEGRRADRIRFAVEVLLDDAITDAFGETSMLPTNRVRYELTIELRGVPAGLRPFVVHEAAHALAPNEDRWARRFSAAGRLVSERPTTYLEYLDTEVFTQKPARFRIWSDPATGRPNRIIPADNATATLLSVTGTTADSAMLFALKREIESWRDLHLDPTALRRPDGFDEPDTLGPDGTHLPNTLHRIARTTGDEDRPDGLLGDISADLASVIADVSRIRIDEDEKRRRREVEFRARGDTGTVSARVASDGTLRAAALLTAAYDPANSGVLCFEEPENGIYPERLITLVRRLRSIVERAIERRRSDPAAPIVQLLLSSHSPTMLRALDSAASNGVYPDAVFLSAVSRVGPGRSRSRIAQPRVIASGIRPTLAAQERLDPNARLASQAKIAEFEVRRELGA